MKTLIIPCAGKSTRFPNMKPKWLLTHPDGTLMIEKAISGIDTMQYDRIIITIVKEHDIKYEAKTILKQAFPSDNVSVYTLENFTSSPSETIYRTVIDNNIKGSFVVKDSDNYVAFINSENAQNFVVGMDLNYAGEISNIKGKSFIILNEQGAIIDIIEKKIKSDVISLGVYGFESSDDFIKAYEDISRECSVLGELYISHIIAYLIGVRKSYFQYIATTGYEDWGTLQDWIGVQKKHQTYFFDIDGVILKNSGKYGIINWDNNSEIIPENVEMIKKLNSTGGQIIFVTSRPECYRERLDALFKTLKIKYHSMVMGCNHACRIIINDFAPTNPYPSCKAINIPRNGMFSHYLEDPNV